MSSLLCHTELFGDIHGGQNRLFRFLEERLELV